MAAGGGTNHRGTADAMVRNADSPGPRLHDGRGCFATAVPSTESGPDILSIFALDYGRRPMSGFDDAVRRAQAGQRHQAATTRSALDVRRQEADRSAAQIQGLLNDFVRFVSSAGVAPSPVLLRVLTRNKRGRKLWRPESLYSPSGYVLREHHETGVKADTSTVMWGTTLASLTLVTPEAKLFQFDSYRHPTQPESGSTLGEFVPVSGESLMLGRVSLTSHVNLDADGSAYLSDPSDSDGIRRIPIDGPLVQLAARLADTQTRH